MMLEVAAKKKMQPQQLKTSVGEVVYVKAYFILTPAALGDSVAVVTCFAMLTCSALSVIQALETGTCQGVT